MIFFTLIFVPAAYTRPPSSVTRSAFLSLIRVAQSSYDFPLTQLKTFKGKLLSCAVLFTYWINCWHLVISTVVAHHLKLIDVAAEMCQLKKQTNKMIKTLVFHAAVLSWRCVTRQKSKLEGNRNDGVSYEIIRMRFASPKSNVIHKQEKML